MYAAQRPESLVATEKKIKKKKQQQKVYKATRRNGTHANKPL